MPRATNDGATIYYEREGDEREAVVFLQDLGYGRWMWRWQREAVRDEYGVVAPDTRGTGRSEDGLPGVLTRLPGILRTPLLRRFAGYSVEGLAADLEAVLDDAGIRDAHLVGAGLGGMVAQRYAVDYGRAATLTLCGTSHGGVDAVPIPDETWDQLFEEPDGADERGILRHQMRPVFTEGFTNRNPHLMDRLLEWRLEQDAGDAAREAQGAAMRNFDAGDELGRIRVPTLVIHGTDDRIVPAANGKLLAEKISDGRLELIEGGSHLVGIEFDDRVNERLLSFLEAEA